jgi:hypothetical protein
MTKSMLIYVIMNRLASIGEASRTLGVSITTLRRWEKIGRIKAEHTAGGHRRYDLAKIVPSLYGLSLMSIVRRLLMLVFLVMIRKTT